MAAIGVWLFCALFMGLVASMIANLVDPVNNEMQALYNSYGNYTPELDINRISTYHLNSAS